MRPRILLRSANGTSVRPRTLGRDEGRLRPRRRAGARASRLRAAARSRPRSRRRSSARSRRASTSSPRRARAPGKSLAYLIPALESGQRVVVATATKALQEQLLAQDVPAAARALGREVRVAVLKGRQNYLCRKQLQGFGPMLLRERARRGGVRGDAALARRDRDRRPRRAASVEPSEALWAELAVGSDRCAGRRCPFVSTCFAEAARARAGEAELVIANHALYFADLAAGRRRAARARRRRLRRGAPARGDAPRRGSAAASRARGAAAARRRRRARAAARRPSPLPARALDRVERAGDRLLRAVAPPSGRRRLREPPAEPLLVLDRRARARSRTSCTGAGRSSTRSRGARSRVAGAGRGVPRARPRSSASSGPSPTRSRGRRSTSRASCASGSGATGRRRSSSPRR